MRRTSRRSKAGAAFDPAQMAEHAGEAAQLLKALANEYRLMILCALAEGELSVGALNARVPLSQSALSQHLAVLREDGLVATRREAQTIYYQATEGPALEVIRVLHELYCCDRGR
jgi:ArsR family transcriptional regulator, virulence genes transcriptional regulator